MSGPWRANVKYNPFIDAQLRWERWTFAFRLIRNGNELIDADTQTIWLDPRVWDRTRKVLGVAHAIAHLDLGHHKLKLDHFTDQHECDAIELALLNLDTSKGVSMITNVNSI